MKLILLTHENYSNISKNNYYFANFILLNSNSNLCIINNINKVFMHLMLSTKLITFLDLFDKFCFKINSLIIF